jgi:Raf kinase inhibitor-like YbhB/YbcL family protein
VTREYNRDDDEKVLGRGAEPTRGVEGSMLDSIEYARVCLSARIHAGLRRRAAIWILAMSWIAPACFAQVLVEPVYDTWIYPDSDADSVATWVAPDPADSLMFVTEKDGDRVEVWSPVSGRPYAPMHFIGGDQNSDEEGQFDRPNAVWVIYHVPFQDEFVDILLVCEQLNGRVQIFRLPELSYFGQFAAGDLSTSRVFGRGLGPYHDGDDHFIMVTDRRTTAKVKRYRLVEDGDVLGAEFVDAFGDETGDDELNIVESVIVDTAHDRIHVCGDEWRTTGEGVNGVRVFDLQGEYTGVTYGEPDFEFDVEGIVLYESGPRDGYIIVSDQYNNGDPNEYEVYDRVTLERIGNFECPDDGALVTTNTDGIYLEQRPFPSFPNGAFFAINDDMNLHVYDWTDIAEALDLEIVALDRSFTLDGGSQPDLPRRSLWHEDSSWWGLFTSSAGLEMRRLEDGTFARQGIIDDGVANSAVGAAKISNGVLALVAGAGAKLYRLEYDASLRRHETTETTALDLGGSERASLSVDPEGDAYVAWAVGGRMLVSGAPIDDLSSWPADGLNLEATQVQPVLVHLPGETTLLGADGISAFACFHTDGAGSRRWRGPSRFGADDAESISAVVVGGELVVSLLTANSVDIWTRDEAGDWSLSESLGEVSSAALSVDAATGAIYLVSAVDGASKRSVAIRSSTGPGEPFGPSTNLIALPGVDMGPPLTSSVVPDGAGDLVVASIGHDGIGYFARVPLPDRLDVSAPVTMQHFPAPGAAEVDDVDVVSFRIADRPSGIDRAAFRVLINGEEVATRIRGLSKNLLVEADLPDGSSREVRVHIEAADLSDPPHVMVPFEYSFTLGVPRRRGDINADSNVDVSDAVALLLFLFADGIAPICDDVADVDDSDRIELTDAIALLDSLFRGGPALPPLSDEELEACGAEAESEEFTLTSSVFFDGSIIPPRNTCQSDDVSPPLEWSHTPEGTGSFALTCIDIDSRAGTYIHWISWDIPGTATSLDEGEEPPVDGTNQWGRRGYGGPCPGRGSGFHRYVFTLHALDVATLSIPGSNDLEDLEDAMEGHVIESTELTGRYRRD